jgi:hypothetical protein
MKALPEDDAIRERNGRIFVFAVDYFKLIFTVVVLETPCDVAVTVTLEAPF